LGGMSRRGCGTHTTQHKKTLHNIDQKYNVDMDSTETKFTMYSSCAIIHKE